MMERTIIILDLEVRVNLTPASIWLFVVLLLQTFAVEALQKAS